MSIFTYRGKSRTGATRPVFISTWDTTQAGSANDTVVLPLQSNGSYDFYVSWGDDDVNRITGYNQAEVTHQYPQTGIYTIKIHGDVSGWKFAGIGDDDKILDIGKWGPLIINSSDAFNGCSLLELSATDGPTITTSDIGSMFANCSSLTSGGFSNFDVSQATDIGSMFSSCTALNDADIALFDTSNVTDFRNCFRGATAFDTSLSGWDFTNNLYTINLFGNTDYFNRHTVDGWVFGTDAAGLFYEAIDFSGASGNVDAINNNPTWSSVTGADTMFASVDFNGAQWVTGIDFSNIEDFSFMFYGCYFPAGFTLSGIDFSSAKNFNYMFGYLNQFPAINSPSFPDLRGVTTGLEKTQYMFQRSYYFDQEVLLDLSNADNISYMFDNASDYNNGGSSSISGWDTSNVTIMAGVFNDANSFNQPIGTWDVSNVYFMAYMFAQATSFNQPLSGWNVSGVETMANMFELAQNFNQDIGAWDVSNVTDMYRMFRGTTFTIGTFNNGGSPSISGWNTSKVQSMDSMFDDQTSFNQPIGAWNTSSLTNINNMLNNADAFDQDLSNWTVTGISNAVNFMNTANGLSTINYDSTLSGWSSQAVKSGVNIHFGGSKYSTATGLAYRNALVASGWTITDGGSV